MPAHSPSEVMFWFMLGLLALVTTFGVGTALSMLFKRWWFSLVLGAIGAVILLVRVGFGLTLPEWILFAVAVIGIILSAMAVRGLKNRGYPLFS